jgi:Protein of unknown function (DUF3617)
MQKSAKFLLFTFIILIVPVCADATPPLNHGRWEITIKTIVPDVTQATTIVCISKEHAEKPEAPKSKSDDDCKVLDPPGLSGNILAYTVHCTKQNLTSQAKFTFDGDRYEGEVVTKINGVETKQLYSARRLGACDAAEGQVNP